MEETLIGKKIVEQLRAVGFAIDVYEDRDLADFNNIRVLECRKDIAHRCTIIYSEYHVARRPGEFELKEQSAELLVGDSVPQLYAVVRWLRALEKLRIGAVI